MRKRRLIIFILILIFICPSNVFATNGSKVIGNGATSPIMGGTGCVEPQDTGGILINPAGITKIGNRVDIATELAVVDAKMDTSGATHPTFRNINGLHRSKAQAIFAPHTGFSAQIGESNWYYGFAGAVVGGLALDYKHSRLSENPALMGTGNEFDKHAELYNFEFVPTVVVHPVKQVKF